MKRVFAATALAFFGLAPAMSSACEYSASMASTPAPEQLTSVPAPEAIKAANATVVKAPATKTAKPASAKIKEPTQNTKLAAASTN